MLPIHIRHIITIDCIPKKVYTLLTEKEGIQGWWTPDANLEPKIGTIAEFNFGNRYHNEMEIIDLQQNKKVVWKCIQGDPEWIDTSFTFNLEDKNGKTILRFGQDNWKEMTDFYAYCNLQWAKYLTSLKDLCETGKGNPFNQFDY